MNTQQIHDTLRGGREAAYTRRDGTRVEINIEQVPFSRLHEYNKLQGKDVELIGLVTGLTPEQVDELETDEVFRLLTDLEEVNSPLLEKWESRQAAKTTKEMTLLKTQFPELFAKAERSMLQKMEQAMAAATVAGTRSSTSSEISSPEPA